MANVSDPNVFNVEQLKDKLKKLNVNTSGGSGTKAELIARLSAADPTGSWMRDKDRSGDSSDDCGLECYRRSELPPYLTDPNLSQTLGRDLLRREKAVIKRELRVSHREKKLLRADAIGRRSEGATFVSGASTSRTNSLGDVNVIAYLLPMFEGDGELFDRWKRQILLLRDNYGLDDHAMKILIAMRLKGRTLEWLHSNSEHIRMCADDLLDAMEIMFSCHKRKVDAYKQLVDRIWKQGEDFIDYFHDKVILAKNVHIDNDTDMADHITDGIPKDIQQNPARMQDFSSTLSILYWCYEKVTEYDSK